MIASPLLSHKTCGNVEKRLVNFIVVQNKVIEIKSKVFGSLLVSLNCDG